MIRGCREFIWARCGGRSAWRAIRPRRMEGGDGDALGGGGGFGDGQAVFAKFFDVDGDAFTDQLGNFFTSFCSHAEAWEIGRVSAPPAVFALLEDDCVLVHLFLQARLPKNTLEGAFRHVLGTMIGDDDGFGLGWVFVDAVTAAGALPVPSVAFD
jgi:hypothetical protein